MSQISEAMRQLLTDSGSDDEEVANKARNELAEILCRPLRRQRVFWATQAAKFPRTCPFIPELPIGNIEIYENDGTTG